MDLQHLRQRLADAGVGLFEPASVCTELGIDEYVELLRALVASGDPRLVASIPCLLAVHDRDAASAAEAAAAGAPASLRDRLGVLHRLARALVISREPDLVHVLRRRPQLREIALEPADLPSPAEDHGERCLAVARERHDGDAEGNFVGDAEDLFDTWLRIAAAERPERAPA